MKCNLDCDYCPPGLYSGHDNTTKHPPLDECLKTIDFMFAYVDLYMQTRIPSLKNVVLNVYGGEALHHPDIVEILKAVREQHKKYQSEWGLTITTTTNAVISHTRFNTIIPLIDEFTVSYHTSATAKQKQQVRHNLLAIQQSNTRCKCLVMMYSKYFDDATDQVSWLKTHNIKHLAKQVDHAVDKVQFNYNEQQVQWFRNTYQSRTFNHTAGMPELIYDSNGQVDLADTGRACCGGRNVCADQNYKSRMSFVDNKFPDWYCSVNHFFLYVKQITKEIFVNKDCKMNFDGSVGPIGHLDQSQLLLSQTHEQLKNNSMPVIQCKKYKCNCGLCAPKARDLDTYKSIMRKYEIPNPNLL